MNVVDLLVIVTPDGKAHYREPDPGVAKRVMDRFRSAMIDLGRDEQHRQGRTIGGVVAIRVLEDDAKALLEES